MFNKKAKIGVFTCFSGSDEAYSLVNVVRVQLQMLLDHDYQPVLFVAPGFTGAGVWSKVEIRKTLSPDSKYPDILKVLRTMIKDIDVMICHDIVFLGQNKEWAKAVRKLAREFPHIAWLHWQHSRGDHAAIEKVTNSWFCYPNQGDLAHVAQINNTDLEHVRYVPHPLDFEYLGWSSLAVKIAEDYEFPFKDVSMIYPSRLDHQKQLDKVVRIFSGLKRAGRSVCLLVADAYCTGEPFLSYKKELRKLAEEQGLNEKELVFLSEKYAECYVSTPRKTVKALLEMSNLFIQPSNAETSSLVVMEASLAGNLVIINGDFRPIHHLYESALCLPFGSVTQDKPTEYYRHVETAKGIEKVIDHQLFWDDKAKDLICHMLDAQLTIKLKRQQLRDRWPNKVFEQYIEPLINEAHAQVVGDALVDQHVVDREITGIITTMDNLALLKRQISILQEECGHLIVVNNGSRDGTKEWLDSIKEKAQITVIHRENNGAGPGRNAGLEEWDKHPTPYTLMVDGGMLPINGLVKAMKDYLVRHPDVHVISPEVASCLTTNEEEATPFLPENFVVDPPATLPDGTVIEDTTFPQCSLSSTAYCLCRAEAWKVRFSEEGPYAEAGWGVDDNDMAYRWNKAGVNHHDFTYQSTKIKLYRHGGGSFQRLFEETGVWPNQYGSVYEKRNVKCSQDWSYYYDPIWSKGLGPDISFVIENVEMPNLAKLVKKLHDENKDTPHEIVVKVHDLSQETLDWLETVRYRWPWGDVTFTPKGEKLIRGKNVPEELWTGNVIVDREPIGKTVLYPALELENAKIEA